MEKKTKKGKILAILLLVIGICLIISVFIPNNGVLIGGLGVALIIVGRLMNIEKQKKDTQ